MIGICERKTTTVPCLKLCSNPRRPVEKPLRQGQLCKIVNKSGASTHPSHIGQSAHSRPTLSFRITFPHIRSLSLSLSHSVRFVRLLFQLGSENGSRTPELWSGGSAFGLLGSHPFPQDLRGRTRSVEAVRPGRRRRRHPQPPQVFGTLSFSVIHFF